MLDSERLLDLVGAIHGGATEPGRWNAALDRLSDALGGSPLLLGSASHTADRFAFAGHRVGREVTDLINGPFANRRANPVFGAVPRAPQFRPVITSSRLGDERFVESPVYKEVLRPIGVRHTMVVVLRSDSRSSLALAVGRGRAGGDYGAAEARLLGAVGPHLNAALLVREELERARARAQLIDAIGRGLFIVDRERRILHANAEAERIVAARDGLLDSGGRLCALRQRDTARLDGLIGEAARAGSGSGMCSGAYASLERSEDLPAYRLRIVPLGRSAVEEFGVRETQAAAVLVTDPCRVAEPRPEALASLFGFTPAEARLAVRIFRGATLNEAAEQLGISPNTAKTHLKTIFGKVGVTRQTQLVRQITAALC